MASIVLNNVEIVWLPDILPTKKKYDYLISNEKTNYNGLSGWSMIKTT